jgi:hypothetical protein
MSEQDQTPQADETTDAAEQNYAETGVITVKCRSGEKYGRRAVQFDREVGKNLDEMVALFGAEVVHGMAVSEFTVRVQGAARTVLSVCDEAGLPKNSIDDAVNAGLTYTPGKSRKRSDAGVSKEKAFNLLAKKLDSGEMTLDELMAEIKRRQGEAAG